MRDNNLSARLDLLKERRVRACAQRSDAGEACGRCGTRPVGRVCYPADDQTANAIGSKNAGR